MMEKKKDKKKLAQTDILTAMKKQMTAAAAFVFLLLVLAGVHVSAEEVQTIVPAIGGAESANVYSYKIPEKEDGNLMIIPVEISRAGMLKMDIKVQAAKSYYIYFSKKSPTDDLSLESQIWNVMKNKTSTSTCKFYAEKPSTCYLTFFTMEKQPLNVTVKAYQNTAKLMTNGKLKNKKWEKGFASYGKDAFFQVKASSSGCLQIDVKPSEKGQSVEITLLNSKKKEVLTDESSSYEKKTYYGVGKGTYYIRVETDGEFQIRSVFESIKEKKNTSKAKAVHLKQGKTEKGLFRLGDKKGERFYKVTVPKTRTVRISISTKTNGALPDFTVYQVQGKKLEEVEYSGLKIGKNNLKVKLKKGTYYFVVNNFSSDSIYGNGSYTIQWK